MDSLRKQLTLTDMLPVIRQTLAEGRNVSFVPQGTSMLPLLRPGQDTVALSPLPEKLKKYDLPLYQRPDGQLVLHRIVEVGETYTCMGDNQFARETGLRREQMIGLVTAFQRDGKMVRADAWRYRLYCRVWHHSRFFRRCLKHVGRIFTGGRK